jgi:hypothetical protein
MGPVQTAVAHVQQIAPQVQQLPEWVEYVKALGTPVAAVIAAAITATIAYRQWVTARNKLKLDLFDKRMEIYRSAIDLMSEIGYHDTILEWDRVNQLGAPFRGARWLLSDEIADYLEDLMECGYQVAGKEKAVTEAQAEASMIAEFAKVKELFAPYLALNH